MTLRDSICEAFGSGVIEQWSIGEFEVMEKEQENCEYQQLGFWQSVNHVVICAMGCSHRSMLDFVVAWSEKRIRSDESCDDG
jgi:hypothetical protein